MQPVHLFDLLSRHVSWASFRQTVVTGNIANANTPGFETQDVKPFADLLDGAGLAMAETQPGHIAPDAIGADGAAGTADGWEISSTGNTVSVEQEMLKADEIGRSVSLDVSIERAFHRMLLSSVRSG